jgi:predicted ATPase
MLNFILQVKNFGKIEEACIEMSDMVFFVGDNNSGKSSMMTLIYGILSDYFFHFLKENMGKRTCRFLPKIDSLLTEENNYEKYFLTNDDIQYIENCVNEILNEKKDEFITRLFSKNIPVEEIKIKFTAEETIAFAYAEIPIFGTEIFVEKYTFEKNSPKLDGLSGNVVQYSQGFKAEKETLKDLSELLMCQVVKILLGSYLFRMPVYLPASRAGLMLSYKSILKNPFSNEPAVNTQTNHGGATLPVVDFINTISSLPEKYEAFSAERGFVVSFIEDAIINGKIITKNPSVPDYSYFPKGTSEPLPLYLSAGIVLEITPLLLVIKNCPMNSLFIEEPELGLHPNLQKQTARVLVRFCNTGHPVFVSTYSESIIQHINNMLTINNYTDKEKALRMFKHDQEDLIESEKVKMYQFDINGNISTVHKLEWNGNDGFR